MNRSYPPAWIGAGLMATGILGLIVMAYPLAIWFVLVIGLCVLSFVAFGAATEAERPSVLLDGYTISDRAGDSKTSANGGEQGASDDAPGAVDDFHPTHDLATMREWSGGQPTTTPTAVAGDKRTARQSGNGGSCR